MTMYGGLLAAITEANDIEKELGVSIEEAREIQRARAAERDREHEAERAAVESRVAEQMGCSLAEARQHLEEGDREAMRMFRVGNEMPSYFRN
jgi:hypothetical protein